MDFNYVAVSHHPSDVVVLNTGMYAEVFSFIHYNRELQKLSSSSSGAQQQQEKQSVANQNQPAGNQPKPINKRRRSLEAIRHRHRLYKLRKLQRN